MISFLNWIFLTKIRLWRDKLFDRRRRKNSSSSHFICSIRLTNQLYGHVKSITYTIPDHVWLAQLPLLYVEAYCRTILSLRLLKFITQVESSLAASRNRPVGRLRVKSKGKHSRANRSYTVGQRAMTVTLERRADFTPSRIIIGVAPILLLSNRGRLLPVSRRWFWAGSSIYICFLDESFMPPSRGSTRFVKRDSVTVLSHGNASESWRTVLSFRHGLRTSVILDQNHQEYDAVRLGSRWDLEPHDPRYVVWTSEMVFVGSSIGTYGRRGTLERFSNDFDTFLGPCTRFVDRIRITRRDIAVFRRPAFCSS